jgi:hypothetical protein
MRIERSIPYFNLLLKAPTQNRMGILKSFPTFVIDDFLEVIYNIVTGHVDVSKGKRTLDKYKKTLLEIANTKQKPRLRRMIWNQKGGGFIGALLPIVLSALASLIFRYKH